MPRQAVPRGRLEQRLREQGRRLAALEAEREAQGLGNRALTAATAAAIIAMPKRRSALLHSILETACRVLQTRAGSLFLVDAAAGELTFEVAVGPEAEQLTAFRVPIGKGLVGWAAATGQAIAVEQAGSDARHYAAISDAIGYTPSSLLCIPLLNGDRVIGVLELLDRLDGQPFSQEDIERGSLFAVQSGIALQQSQSLGHLLDFLLAALDDTDDGATRDFGVVARRVSASPGFEDAVALGALVATLAERGPAAVGLCRSVLTAIAAFTSEMPGVATPSVAPVAVGDEPGG